MENTEISRLISEIENICRSINNSPLEDSGRPFDVLRMIDNVSELFGSLSRGDKDELKRRLRAISISGRVQARINQFLILH